MPFDASSELVKVNAQLKILEAGVAIKQISRRLYLTATLPPKPGRGLTKPRNQRIALGVYANPAGFKRAKAEALKLSGELTMGKFEWENWGGGERQQLEAKTVANWVREFEASYFTRRSRTPKTQTTWDKDYRDSYNKLPQDAELTPALLRRTVENRTDPDTRTRQRVCTAFNALAKFAGLDCDLSPLRGKYSPKAVNPRDLPSNETILEWWERFPHEEWRNLYALMATYGLRDHEAFYIEMASLREPPGIATVLEGKTGYRLVWPYPPEWWEKFGLNRVAIALPNITVKRNCDYGSRVSQYFRRKGTPFTPYDLRHAWAARTSTDYGLEAEIAARMMGHDLKVHTTTYHAFIKKAQMQIAVDRSLRTQ
jgi:integrase